MLRRPSRRRDGIARVNGATLAPPIQSYIGAESRGSRGLAGFRTKLFSERPEIDAGAWRYAAHTGQLPTRLASDWKESRSPSDLTLEEWARHVRAMIESTEIPAVQGGLTADTITAIGDPA